MRRPAHHEVVRIALALEGTPPPARTAPPPPARPGMPAPLTIPEAFAALVAALGLPPDADGPTVADAIDAYLASAPSAPVDAPLTAAQLKLCRAQGLDPVAYARLKACIANPVITGQRR